MMRSRSRRWETHLALQSPKYPPRLAIGTIANACGQAIRPPPMKTTILHYMRHVGYCRAR